MVLVDNVSLASSLVVLASVTMNGLCEKNERHYTVACETRQAEAELQESSTWTLQLLV